MYRSHVLVCGGTGCTSSNSLAIIEALESEIAKKGLQDEVKVVRTGCFGLCALGPIMIVYPYQHWITLVSAYQHTPYFLYFADYLRPFYEKEYKWLLDLNDELNATLVSLINKQRPALVESQKSKVERRTADWSGQIWTDKHPWQTEISVLDTLFDE